ncbi:hypothetical protein Maes01_02374 [Microbulbifer aestuariivivens]|uniref:Lipoprotein n=1 Tax=Microbulbifer aestuariivivens TaxID=1908308 RepID=A0ABP9WTJ5_9GAMM
MSVEDTVKRLFIILSLCTLVACAHSPIQIQVRPQVQVAPSVIGSGYTLSVQGVSELPEDGLGSLGGIYADTANIRLANSVEDALASALAEGFAQWGFRTVPATDPSARVQVVADLTGLKYDSPNKIYTSQVDSEAEIQLTVRIGGATYFGSYRSSGKDRSLIKPNKEEVETRLNGLLSATLQRVFEDEKIKMFLQANL